MNSLSTNRRIRTINKLRPNVFESIKRAYIRMGIVPRQYHSKNIITEDTNTKDQPVIDKKITTDEITLEPEKDDRMPQEEFNKLDQAGRAQEQVKIMAQETEDEAETGPQKLLEATEKSHDILFATETIFPFTIFPDHVSLDREKLTIAHRNFFKMSTIVTMPVVDILSVEADVGPFFGSIHTTSRYFVTSPHTVNFLSRKDTEELHRLLQGYIIAHEQNIDCSAVETEELKVLLKDLGQGAPD